MKHLSLSVMIMSLVACGTQAPQRPVLKQSEASASRAPVIEKSTPQQEKVFTPESIAAMQPSADETPVNESDMSMNDMKQKVQASFASSNLAPADSAAMNADVQALIGAAEAKDFAQVSKLANDLVAKAAGLKGLNLPGLGLVDIAGILDAVQDLAGAALALDIAGVLQAVMDLVAAVGA